MARILVIDDEEAARYGIVRALAPLGHDVEEAADGMEAVSRLGSFRPDVIVSDINMPALDGLSLLRRLRECEEGPLVILVTAYGSEGRVLEALRAGAYDYLSKPFEIEDLRLAVRNAVERQALAAQNRRYREAVAQAERLAALGRLVAGITHELNNPLGALLSGVDTLERVLKKVAPSDLGGEMLAMAQQAADSARGAGTRLSRVVHNLKAFSRIDSAQRAEARLSESIETVLSLLERDLDGIAVNCDLDRNVIAAGEVLEWNEVALHLLLNARDAIHESGRKGHIRVRVAGEAEHAVLEIEDNGDGIPAGELPRVFDPGFTTKGAGVGTGLGLAICFRIVRSRGGTIDVDSRQGAGTVFTIRVPFGGK